MTDVVVMRTIAIKHANKTYELMPVYDETNNVTGVSVDYSPDSVNTWPHHFVFDIEVIDDIIKALREITNEP